MDSIFFENKRKLFHMTSVIFPIIYHFIEKKEAVILSSIYLFIFLFLDVYRYKFPQIQYYLLIIFKNFMRKNEIEKNILLGSTWMALGIFTTILLFEKNIAILSMLILSFCDSAAALIGKKYGKIKINGKSLEGSSTFFITAVFVSIIFNNFLNTNFSITSIFFASVASTFAELYGINFKIDDNLSIPISFGIFLTLI